MIADQLKQIGIVRCEVPGRQDMPTFGVPSVIEIFPEYTDGLQHLEKHSHLWVIVWLHEAKRDRLLITPRGVADKGEAGFHGVFAARSPTRPNPIGMTAVQIDKIEENRIHVNRLDFLDGTPVLDLKPYFRSRDAIYAARNQQIGRPAGREAMLESLLYQAENFHGERCGGVALGARIVEHWRSSFLDYVEVLDGVAHVPKASGCLIDVIMALVGATPGQGTLLLHGQNSVELVKDHLQCKYQLQEPGRHWRTWGELTFDGVLAIPESELFIIEGHHEG